MVPPVDSTYTIGLAVCADGVAAMSRARMVAARNRIVISPQLSNRHGASLGKAFEILDDDWQRDWCELRRYRIADVADRSLAVDEVAEFGDDHVYIVELQECRWQFRLCDPSASNA